MKLKICEGNVFVFKIPLVQKCLRPLPKGGGGSFSLSYPWLGEHLTICSMAGEWKDGMKSE